MRLLNADTRTNATTTRLILSLASTHREVREVQPLRCKIFIESDGRAGLAAKEGRSA